MSTLPNFENAVIDDKKFSHYALDPSNTNGGAEKAVVFKAALGYTQEDAPELIQKIRDKMASTPAIYKGTGYNNHEKYELSTMIHGKNGKDAPAITAWMVEDGVPRLVTSYVDSDRQKRMGKGNGEHE